MNEINIPPSREPAVALGDNMQIINKYVPAPWIQWFSDVAAAINESQATGTTAQRPNPPPFIGFMYFDTTLGKPIWAETAGGVYVDATGTPV